MHDLESELRSCQIKGHSKLKAQDRACTRERYICTLRKYTPSKDPGSVYPGIVLYPLKRDFMDKVRTTIPSKSTQTQAQTCSVSHGDARAKAPPITVINR